MERAVELLAVAALVIAGVSDLRSRRVPNTLTRLALICGVITLIWATPLDLAYKIAGGLLSFLAELIARLRGHRLQGGGDVKYEMAVGLLFGLPGLVADMLVAAILIVITRQSKRTDLPLCAYLTVGVIMLEAIKMIP